jgi:hypothetical protein
MAPARREAPCQGSSRPLENPDLRGRLALSRHRCAVRLRRSNQWRKFQGLCRTRAFLILFESGGFPNRFRSDSRRMLGWRPACMGRAYSLDLRKRVVAAVVGGKSRRAAAALFDVSVASVVKWTQRAYETGSPAAGRWVANGPIFCRASATGCWRVSTRSRSDAACPSDGTRRARRDGVL